MTEYYTESTVAPTCPYCGYVDRDVFRLNFNKPWIMTTCIVCESEFIAARDFSVTYTTEKRTTR